MICKTVFEMENAGDLKYHKVSDAIVGLMNKRARVLEPWILVNQVGGLVRERAQDSYDWDRGDEQSTFDVAAVGKGMSGVLSSLRGIWLLRQRVPNTREQRKGEGSEGWQRRRGFKVQGER